jgi:hypothetical protein
VSEIPHETLSEHFESRMASRRLRHLVLTTFQFDPGFFEQEILPVFLDTNLSHVRDIKLAQLEETLRSQRGGVAVYYDADGLVLSDDGSAKLDVRRVPVRCRNGAIFHAKNVFALVESIEPDDDGSHRSTLLAACLSANLTRSGWWMNAEICHVEELAEREPTCLRPDLLKFFALLRALSPDETDHSSLDAIHEFVLRTENETTRVHDGRLRPHFVGGDRTFDECLDEIAGKRLRELNLEVISPYLDDASSSTPLEALLKRFKPCETRIFLPRTDAGEAACNPEIYAWVAAQDGVTWARFPKGFLRAGKSEQFRERFVHAKVYRFFSSTPKRELLVVGSHNLTRSAHQRGGNVESAFLLEIEPPRRPEFWMERETRRPIDFVCNNASDEDIATCHGSRLAIRYTWDRDLAEAYWDARIPSPALTLSDGGLTLGDVPKLASQTWVTLDGLLAARLRDVLRRTSFIDVVGDRPEPVPILVQEEGMWQKPPFLTSLSVRDILRYWSLLTPEQRNDFLASRGIEQIGVGGELVTRYELQGETDSLFDRFAGVFHGFDSLRTSVLAALDEGNEKVLLYRLFSSKHDSLGSLLERMATDDKRDPVEQYVMALCARQLRDELVRAYPEFWRAHAAEATKLDAAVLQAERVRSSLPAEDPSIPAFLDWFEGWFLKRAQPVTTAARRD